MSAIRELAGAGKILSTNEFKTGGKLTWTHRLYHECTTTYTFILVTIVTEKQFDARKVVLWRINFIDY